MELTLRNAPLTQLRNELKEQQDRKVDLIVPARDVWSHAGFVVVRGMGPNTTLTGDGVTRDNLVLTPTGVFDEGLSSKLSQTGRPLGLSYVRGLRNTGRTDLIDANVNGLLHGNADLGIPGDPRRFLLRTFTGEDGHTGHARALLSDSYKTIDNWDVLHAALRGMAAAGLDAHVVRNADLTDSKMYVKIVVPELKAYAPELLRDYVSPYSKKRGSENPTVFAGFVLSNSETGGGAYTLTPRLEVEICTNGMTISEDVMRVPHLGSKLGDDGAVDYSDETHRLNLKLLQSKTTDTVRSFLEPAYMERVIRLITEKAGRPVEKPADIVKTITKRSAFTKDDADGIMDAFTRGGDMTRGGVMQAITAFSQSLSDADRAYAMDADALAAAGITGVTGLVKA